MAYVLIVFIGIVGFYQFEQADQESEKQRMSICERQRENRDALRQAYRDVADLGRKLTATSDPKRRPILREEIDRFERDRLNSLPQIKAGCEENEPQ